MEFKHINQAKFDECELVAYHSTGDRYRIGIRRMLFGFRVFVDKIGDRVYLADYCCATDEIYIFLVFHLLANILNGIDEDTQSYLVERSFPKQQFKPIKNDLPCFLALNKLAMKQNSSSNMPPTELFLEHIKESEYETQKALYEQLRFVSE
jgi:hypothetical protein